MTLTQRLYTGFIVAFLMVLGIGLVNYKAMERRKKENTTLFRTYEALHQLTSLEKLMVDMETGRRGYRLTAMPEFLEPGRTARPILNGILNELNGWLKNRPAQKTLLHQLEAQISAMDSLDANPAVPVAASDYLAITRREKIITDSARALVAHLYQIEKSELDARQQFRKKSFQQASVIILLGTLLTEGLILVLFLAILQALQLRRKAEAELQRKMLELKSTNRAAQDKNWLLTGISEIKDSLQGATSTNQLALQVLRTILNYIDAPGGAIYVLDEEDNTHLLLAGSLGVPITAQPVVQVGRGLIGSVAQAEQTRLIREVPAGYWQFESATGKAVPGSLLLVPFCNNHQLRGVLELASFGGFSLATRQLVEEVATNIAIAFNAIAASNQAVRLLMQVREQKEALELQQEELRQTNEALTRQAEELQVSEEELRVQEEELRQVNAELQEKNKAMEAARHDLTQQAAQLQQTSRYKSEFLANMSHELRTPLNSILLLARILADNKEGNLTGKQAHLAATIHKSGEDLLNLINDILDLSKIEAGKAELHLEQANLRQTLHHLQDLFAPLAEEKKFAFSISIAPEVPEYLYTDAVRLSQVLKNLLSNAFKFTQPGGRITLQAAIAGEMLDLRVIDTGIGIPPEKQQLIFEAFQQADGSTSRRFGGTGLGLSITRELVRLLGGTISLESEAGKGSTFKVMLPQHAAPPKDAASEALTAVPRQVLVPDDRNTLDTHKPRVLIIEDDPDFATMLRNVARESGYQAIVALRGDEGLQCAQQYQPQAIVLDMHLPVMDGWQLSRFFQEDKKLRNIPLHIISGAEEKMPEGIAVLKKPLSKVELEAAFRNISGGQQGLTGGKVLVLAAEPSALGHQLSERMPGLDITFAQDTEAAKALLLRQSFDCLIADLGRQVKTGIAALQALKPALADRHIPVIISMDGTLDKQDELELGKLSDVIIHYGEKSAGRLHDEVAFFLNQLHPAGEPNKLPPLHSDQFFKDRKVLVADDDMRNLFALSTLLEEQGMEVVAAADGLEALDALKNNPGIEAVLIDVMMPEMDGYEVIRNIRKNPAWQHLPVITLTAKAMAGDREESLRAGANDYISKPVAPQRLLSLLRVWLAR